MAISTRAAYAMLVTSLPVMCALREIKLSAPRALWRPGDGASASRAGGRAGGATMKAKALVRRLGASTQPLETARMSGV